MIGSECMSDQKRLPEGKGYEIRPIKTGRVTSHSDIRDTMHVFADYIKSPEYEAGSPKFEEFYERLKKQLYGSVGIDKAIITSMQLPSKEDLRRASIEHAIDVWQECCNRPSEMCTCDDYVEDDE